MTSPRVMIRHIGLAICLFAAMAVASLAQDSKSYTPPDPARMAAARELMDVMGVTKQMETAMETMKQAFLQGAESAPDDKKAQFSKEFDDGLKRLMTYREEMMNDFAALYSKHFTAEEMQAVSTFYRSGAGAKFIQITPELMKEGSAIGIKYSTKMMEELKAEKAGAAAPK